jgi:hypothetical protein
VIDHYYRLRKPHLDSGRIVAQSLCCFDVLLVQNNPAVLNQIPRGKEGLSDGEHPLTDAAHYFVELESSGHLFGPAVGSLFVDSLADIAAGVVVRSTLAVVEAAADADAADDAADVAAVDAAVAGVVAGVAAAVGAQQCLGGFADTPLGTVVAVAAVAVAGGYNAVAVGPNGQTQMSAVCLCQSRVETGA